MAEEIQKKIKEKLETKAEEMGVPYLSERAKVEIDTLNVLPEEVAKKYKMAVFEFDGKKAKVAMEDPQDFEALNNLRFISQNKKIEFDIYLASPENLKNIIGQYSGSAEKAVAEAVKSLREEKEEAQEGVSMGLSIGGGEGEFIQDAPVTKLLSVIMKHAIEGNASDIHIEPVDKDYRIRFRVDGVLHSSLVAPKEVGKAVVSRIKILSSLKIDEKRKPQDGRFSINESGKRIDFRVSTFPVVDGEKVVMRLLDKEGKNIDVEALGLIGKNKRILLKNIRLPYGIILITGPTGSGKSTTLYSFLQILNKEERNIVTLEDPVEYSIEGINQSQIKPEIGYTFANGLRSILRQDPNVIMVGEVRDGETAELTIHAALTGHLVFSTLHTNSSIGAIPRLVDMGIEPFLLSSSLQVVAAQRLVRQLCKNCKEEVKVPDKVVEGIRAELSKMKNENIEEYGVNLEEEVKFYRGKGCDHCNDSGYKGRIAIFEALEVDDKLKDIITEKNGNETYIQQYAKEAGMIKMREDGILKAIKGMTTLSEVERVTKGTMSVGGEVDDDMG